MKMFGTWSQATTGAGASSQERQCFQRLLLSAQSPCPQNHAVSVSLTERGRNVYASKDFHLVEEGTELPDPTEALGHGEPMCVCESAGGRRPSVHPHTQCIVQCYI